MLPIVLILLAAGGLYMASGLRTANAGDKLQIVPRGLKFKGFENAALKLEVSLEGTNPTNTDLKLEQIFLDFRIPQGILASIRYEGDQALRFTFPANKVSTLTIPVQITLIQLVMALGKTIASLLKDGKFPNEVTITGTMRANGFSKEYNQVIPFSHP